MIKPPRPALVLVLLGPAIVLAVLARGDGAPVATLLRAIQPRYLGAILLAQLAYEVIQGVQWHGLLRALGIHVPARAVACAYVLGQPTRFLPVGNFTQNGLLWRSTGADIGRSAAATTFSVLVEVAVALAGLAVLGLGSWDWLRPLIAGGLAVFLPCAWMGYRLTRGRRVPARVTAHKHARAIRASLRRFRAGTGALCRPRVLARASALGALYLALGGTMLYLALRGLGVTTVPWEQVLAAYLFSLALALILPLPMDIGVTEAGGVGALLAIGVSKGAAVGAVLLVRAVSLGGALTLALLVLALLRMETRFSVPIYRRQRARSELPGRPTVARAQAMAHHRTSRAARVTGRATAPSTGVAALNLRSRC